MCIRDRTYNATSNIFHADGAPLETDMSLSFQEQKSLTRKDLYDIEGDDGTDTESTIFTGTEEVGDPEAATGTPGG